MSGQLDRRWDAGFEDLTVENEPQIRSTRIVAQYPGRCIDCGGVMHPGTIIETDTETLGWRHATPTCADTTDPGIDAATLTIQPGEVRCDHCFCYHRGECA